MEKSKKFYSVWALFDYKHQKEIEKIRNKVNNFILGPSFNIHLTLSCCLFGKRKEIIDQMKEIKSYLMLLLKTCRFLALLLLNLMMED